MADDGGYIFENKRETSMELVLANGGVTSVLRGIRLSPVLFSASFKQRGSMSWNSDASNYPHFDLNGLFANRSSGRVDSFSAFASDRVFSVSGLSPRGEFRSVSGMMQTVSASRRGNASNGVDLTVMERETPVFSGLFADRKSEDGRDRGTVPTPVSAGGVFSLACSADTKILILPAGSDIDVIADFPPADSGNGAGTSPVSTLRTVRRSLTLRAEDMDAFKFYQVGGSPSEAENPESGFIVSHSGKTYSNGYLSPSGEYCVPESADGNAPGDVIVVDDSGSQIGGWITIPERPIGGWGWIPERPIGGWIIEPLPFEEYDIFEDYGVDLSSGWTEYTDSDFSKVDLDYASKLSFSVSATNAATFTIYRCVQDGNGGYTLKALQTTALAYDAESGTYAATTRALLMEAGRYCLCVQASGPVREGDPPSSYQFELNRENSDMFVDGDNSDDWTDLRTEGEFGEVAYAGVLDECSFDVLSDWVGFGDSIDYAGFTLNSAAKLSFSLNASDATKFTIYKLVQDRNGKYSLKTLQTTTLTYDSEFEEYDATTKALLLEAGDYYFSMQSTNAAKGGSAEYDIYLNTDEDDCEFFTEGDNSDDWTDLEQNGPSGMVGDAGIIDENSFELRSDWVGFGDEIDYTRFTLNGAAKLSFSLNASGAAKFTIYQLVQDKNGKYSLKTLQTTTLTYDSDFEEYDATTKALLLEAGEYCFSVQSTDAAKGGSVEYDVCLNWDENGSEFFAAGNDDWSDLELLGPDGSVGDLGMVDEYTAELTEGFLAGKDEDYAKISLYNAAKLSFVLNADNAAKFTVYQLVRGKSGKYSLDALQTTSLSIDRQTREYDATTKALLLEAGDYYISMKSDSPDGVNYRIELNGDGSTFYVEGFDGDDWTDLKTTGAYGEVGYVGAIDEYSGELLTDWVGFGDSVDYMGFTLFNASKLSFTLNASDAAEFAIYQLVRDKRGVYSLKTLQTTSLTFDKASGEYDAVTKGLLLEAGDYYFSMRSTNAAQGGSAYYAVSFNADASAFYPDCDNSDDWTDLKTEGPFGMVGDIGVVDESGKELASGWVGFGDEYDYAAFTLFDDAELSFMLESTGAATFTVYSLVEGGNGTFKLKTLQSSALLWNKQTRNYTVNTKSLGLDAGDYYFSMQSTDAAQGGGAYYTLTLNESSRFFPVEDDGDNWGAIDYDPSYEPVCRLDPAEPEPVWSIICGYPPCDEPVEAEPVAVPVDDVLAQADVFAADGCAGFIASGLSENKPVDALKVLSSIA